MRDNRVTQKVHIKEAVLKPSIRKYKDTEDVVMISSSIHNFHNGNTIIKPENEDERLCHSG